MNDETRPLVFVLMPFSKEFDGLYENAIYVAADKAGARAERVDMQKYKDEDVLERIADQIDKAAVLVAVITGNKPNVFYEIGWAHALRKHVVVLTDKPEDIPYDLKHVPSLSYKGVDDELVTKLAEDLNWHLSHPTISDRYYQEFKATFKDVESVAGKLMPFFIPIANRRLLDWSEYVRQLTSDGADMAGPERLEITRLLTLDTRKYSLIEQVIGNRTAHSMDWRAFYGEIGALRDIDKTWMLFVETDEMVKKRADVKDTWEFFRERHFTTLYCSPTEFRRATGKKLPAHHVIEDFGEYVKLLSLPHGSYTSVEDLNVLGTTIRVSNSHDKDMLESMRRCSFTMDEKWFENIPWGLPGKG